MPNKLDIFIDRMEKIGIDIKLSANYPWIYIDSINGKRVKEVFMGRYGFTIAFLPLRNNEELKLTDVNEIFKLIRKYIQKTKKN